MGTKRNPVLIGIANIKCSCYIVPQVVNICTQSGTTCSLMPSSFSNLVSVSLQTLISQRAWHTFGSFLVILPKIT